MYKNKYKINLSFYKFFGIHPCPCISLLLPAKNNAKSRPVALSAKVIAGAGAAGGQTAYVWTGVDAGENAETQENKVKNYYTNFIGVVLDNDLAKKYNYKRYFKR